MSPTATSQSGFLDKLNISGYACISSQIKTRRLINQEPSITDSSQKLDHWSLFEDHSSIVSFDFQPNNFPKIDFFLGFGFFISVFRKTKMVLLNKEVHTFLRCTVRKKNHHSKKKKHILLLYIKALRPNTHYNVFCFEKD